MCIKLLYKCFFVCCTITIDKKKSFNFRWTRKIWKKHEVWTIITIFFALLLIFVVGRFSFNVWLVRSPTFIMFSIHQRIVCDYPLSVWYEIKTCLKINKRPELLLLNHVSKTITRAIFILTAITRKVTLIYHKCTWNIDGF